MNLHESTIRLLSETEIPKPQIAKDCNVSPRWLGYLSSGAERQYSVVLVQRVYDYLAELEQIKPTS